MKKIKISSEMNYFLIYYYNRIIHNITINKYIILNKNFKKI